MTDLFTLVFAFFMGLLSLISPCVLPIIPSYIVYLFGKNKIKMIKGALSIYLGIIVGGVIVGMLLTVVSSLAGSKIFYGASAFLVLLLIIDALGAGFLKGSDFGLLKNKRGTLGGFTFGLIIIFVAAPCVMPLLIPTIIVGLTTTESLSKFLLIMSYSTGLGLPFIILSALSNVGIRLKYVKGKWFNGLRILILVGTLVWLIWSLLSL